MAFSSTFTGVKDLGNGMKRFFGTWNCASVTNGTVTWKNTTSGNQNVNSLYAVVGGGVVQSTAVTTAAATAGCKITAGTLVVDSEADAAGYWWVDVL